MFFETFPWFTWAWYRTRQKKRDRYRVSFREGKTASILTKRQVVDLLNQLKDRKTYLIQQAVQMKYGKSPVDFRVYMQKDSRQQWTCKGMVARIAKAGSIVTNLGYLDRLMYPDEAIQKVYQLNHDEAKSLERQIREVCCNVCNTLDRLSVGLYGDVAIDPTVDRNRKVWILEINKKYGCKFLELLGDTHLLREILTGPLKYAKALAGFPD
ncbi:YheC/YheD family protein [Polycladomyces abyssicola]|uniref:YheC/YheD family protein n=1 Tax=Polycladomyces abyssicola TaxID=1125966 RepID=UPI001BB2E8D8|nr:YheC/YheD family protein [Polycladomyces abyssicola]